MKKLLLDTLFLTASCICAACGSSGADPELAPVNPVIPETPADEELIAQNPSKTNAMKIYAHYMPWFVNPTASGVWNHWTMSANALNSTNYASWYHPLTDAYASDDAIILDYQCLLMKYAGIDGVMVDWYGTQQKNDYPQNEINTKALLKAIEKANLKMAIVYEDATLDGLDDSGKQTQARSDMQYLNSTYFKSSSYVKVGDKPLLLCFGPQQLTSPKGWSYAFGTLATKPQFIVLNGFSNRANDASNTNAQGEFLWVNPHPSYSDKDKFGMYIGGAMPGFYDHYKESGQGNGYTTYDREDGALFQRQLDAAKNAGLDWVQLSTWNDYGEGTIIEPTTEFKYQYLEMAQKFAGVGYTNTQFDIIYRWYQVAKTKGASHSDVQKAYDYLNALHPDKADEIIKKLE
jgi:hypothetical protein